MHIIIAVALLPTLILFWLLRRMSHRQLPPGKGMLKAFLYGLLAFILIVIVAIFLIATDTLPSPSGYPGEFAAAFWMYAIPEEGLKFFMLWLLLRRNPTLCRTRMDCVAYGAIVSLGLATPENLSYLMFSGNNLFGVAFNRTLFSVPGHFCYGVIMGHFLAHARFGAAPWGKYALGILGLPILLHGIFDCLVVLARHGHPGTTILCDVVFSIILWWITYRCIRRSRAAAPAALPLPPGSGQKEG